MEITPEIFIESDEYHIAERQILGTLLASRLYGIFPDSKYTIDYEIFNNQMVVQISNCIALVSSGEVIHIRNKTSFNRELPIDEISVCYVVLSVIANDEKRTDESALHIVPQYDISFKSTHEPIENGIPVLKIFKRASSWEVDPTYIPPSIALSSTPSLMSKYVEIKNVINRIIHCYAEKDSNYLLIMILQIDLNSFSAKETPETLTQMMKKFCVVFQASLKTVKGIEFLQSVKKFMDLPYNHSEIGEILDAGYAGMMEIVKILETEPVPEIEEIKV